MDPQQTSIKTSVNLWTKGASTSTHVTTFGNERPGDMSFQGPWLGPVPLVCIEPPGLGLHAPCGTMDEATFFFGRRMVSPFTGWSSGNQGVDLQDPPFPGLRT